MSRTYETAIRIGASISKAFKSDTYNAAAALTKLVAATKNLKAAEKSAAAYKKLDGELTRAKARYDVASEALRKLEEAERAAGGATKESTRWRKAGTREVAAAARQLDRATKAQQKNAETLQKLGVDTSKVASEQERLTRALAATERQEKSLERYEHARERLFGKRKEKTPLFEKGKEQIRGIGESLMHVSEIAVGAGAGLFELVRRVGDAGDATAKMAKRVGIGVQALQELRYAGEREGASADEVDNGIGKMLINIGKWKAEARGKGAAGGAAIPGMQMLVGNKAASAGGGSVLDPFKMLGLNAAKLAQLKPEQQVEQIAGAMATLKTQSDRAAVSQAIFGREAGLKFLPLLAMGAKGISGERQEARDLGYVLDNNASAAAEEFNDRMLDAQLAATGMANTLGVALLPVVTDTFKQFTRWVKTNRVEIKKWITDAASWIEKKGVPALFKIGGEVKSVASKVLHLVEVGAKLTGGLGNLALVVAGLRVAPLAITFAQIAWNGAKAARAVYLFAEASKAARAAKVAGLFGGAAPGAGMAAAGTAMGLAAKASMILGAAAVGYAIGTAIDNYLGASDKIAAFLGKVTGQDAKLKKIEDTNVKAFDIELQRKKMERDFRVRQFEMQGLTHGQALYAADHGGPPSTSRTGGGGNAHFSHVTNIHEARNRADVEKGMDKAKQHALDAWDRREAHRKRVSFGH